ncbi:MAG: hypothetical protein AB7E60_11145 [Sphingobium sp.]
MLTLLSALVFSGAFVLAIGTIGGMLFSYRDKMMAALLGTSRTRDVPACSIHITRRRGSRRGMRFGPTKPASALAA